MNHTQVNIFLACLSKIDDINFLALRNYHSNHDHLPQHIEENKGVSNSIVIAKATAMAVLFCASAICGSIPFLLNRYFKWTQKQSNARSAIVVQCLLYFGGGVLLATTFLHLLPEVQVVVETLQNCGIIPVLQFPLAELLMCSGFFFMYLIEESIHAFIDHQRKRFNIDEACAASAFERGHSVRNSYMARVRNNNRSSEEEINEKETNDHIEKVLPGAINSILKNENPAVISNSEIQHCDNNHAHTHLPFNEADGILTSSIRGLFIVLALSLHELFEGMAIGLENASAAAVWFMFGAVSAHKLVLAFCVGVELIVARTRIMLAIIYVSTFAIVSPIGIGIGMLLSSGTSDGSAAPSIPAAILQGLACGTLLYVVFFEILSKEHTGLRTYLAVVVGFLAMFALQQVGTGGHGHSHGECNQSLDDHHDHLHSENYQQGNKTGLADHIRMLRNASERIIKRN